MSLTTPTHLTNNHIIHYLCMYADDKRFFNTSTLHLSTLYPDPHDVVTGCTVDSRKHSFKRTYFNFGSAIFNITVRKCTFNVILNLCLPTKAAVHDSWS